MIASPSSPRLARRARTALALLGLLAGLVAGGVGGWFALRPLINPSPDADPAKPETKEDPPPGELTYLPDRCHIIALVSPRAYFTSEAHQKAQELGVAPDDADLAPLRRYLALPPADLKRLILGARLGDKTEWTLVAETMKPVTIRDIAGEDLKSSEVGRHTVHERDGLAFVLVDKQTVIVGPADDVRRVLEREKPAAVSEGMNAILPRLDATWALWAGVDVAELPNKGIDVPDWARKGVRSAVVESPAEAPFQAQLVMRCQDEPAARQALEALNDLVRKLGRNTDLPEAVRLPQALTLMAQGDRLQGRLAVPTSAVVESLWASKWGRFDYCVAALADPAETKRKEAAARLFREPAKSLPYLVKGLEKEDGARLAILDLLARMGETADPAAPAVARLLSDSKPNVRKTAIDTLGRMSRRVRDDVLAELLHARIDADRSVRESAGRAIEQLGPLKREDAPVLVRSAGVAARSAAVRFTGLRIALAFDNDAPGLADALALAARDTDRELRVLGLDALGRVGAKNRSRAFVVLIERMRDKDPEVQALAEAGLDNLGTPSAAEGELLLGVFRDRESARSARVVVARILARLKRNASRNIVLALFEALNDPQREVRAACAKALDDMPDPVAEDVPALVRELTSDKASEEMIRHVVRGLGELARHIERARVAEVYRATLKVLSERIDLTDASTRLLEALGPPGDDLTPALAAVLTNGKALTAARMFAINTLAPRCTEGSAVATALVAAFRDEVIAVRRTAVQVVVKAGLKSPEVIAALSKSVEDDNVDVRLEAATGLVALPVALRPLPALLRAFEDSDSKVARKAIEGLAGLGKATKADLAKWTAAAEGRKLRTRLYVLSLVADQGADGVDLLVAALKDNDGTIRAAALDGLARIGPAARAAVPAIVPIIKEPDPISRMRAVLTLVALRQEPAAIVPVIFDALKDNKNREHRLAVEALEKLGDWAAPAAGEIAKHLDEVRMRPWAALGLSTIGKPAVPELAGALERSKDDGLTVLLLDTLARLGPVARDALPAIEKRIGSGPDLVQQSAKRAQEQVKK